VIASAYDGTGSRSMWFGAERPLGGIYLVAVVLNDVDGLVDCAGRDTTRKRFAEQEATMREKDITAWVELPNDYARQLVLEGVDLAQASGQLLPPGYAMWADLIGNPAEPFSQALVYAEISAFETRMHPTLEGETPRLFTQPEVESWFFRPEEVQKWLHQLAEPPGSRLLVTPESEQDRVERVMREAVKELLPPARRAGLKRRLEETAYIFLRTDRMADARRAVQAAATIEEERPLRPPHPFLRALMERSLRIALEVERSDFEPTRLARVP
jgi:predicted RNA-binding Zn ribbon-like protein